MKAFNLLIISALLLLSSCSSSVVNRAKLSAADAVGKYSNEFLQTQARKELGLEQYKALNCSDEGEILSGKLRDGVDSVLKAEREQESRGFKSVSGDIVSLGCDFLLKQVISIAVAGQFDEYICAQKMFGRGLEKAADKLCPYIKSKME